MIVICLGQGFLGRDQPDRRGGYEESQHGGHSCDTQHQKAQQHKRFEQSRHGLAIALRQSDPAEAGGEQPAALFADRLVPIAPRAGRTIVQPRRREVPLGLLRSRQGTKNGDTHLRSLLAQFAVAGDQSHVEPLGICLAAQRLYQHQTALRRRKPLTLLFGPGARRGWLSRLSPAFATDDHDQPATVELAQRLTQTGGRDRSRHVEDRRRTRVVAGCRNRRSTYVNYLNRSRLDSFQACGTSGSRRLLICHCLSRCKTQLPRPKSRNEVPASRLICQRRTCLNLCR